MKTVILKYPGGKGKQLKKFKVAPATKGSAFRSFITRELNQFYDTDYFLLNLSNGFEILDESLPFSEITSEKKLPLQLVYSHTTVTYINSLEQKKSVNIDLKAPCERNIMQIINSPDAKYYAFAFRPSDDPTYLRITCKSMPLVFQGWYGEQLYLTRYILPTETGNIEDLYSHCVFSLKLSLSVMLPYDWVRSSIFRLIADGKSPKDISKQHLVDKIPHQIRLDDSLFAHGQKVLYEYQKISKEEAKRHFIEACTLFGGHCCYIDRVQMSIVGKWRILTTRYIYINPISIFVSKDFGANIIQKVTFTEIMHFSSEDDFVVLTFHNGTKWRLKSKNKAILLNILSDVKSIIPSRADQTLSQAFSKDKLLESAENFSLSDSQESQTEEEIQVSNVVQKLELEHATVTYNGISPLITPSASEKDKIFNVKPLLFRNLKCIQKVEIPDIVDDVQIDPVPDLSMANSDFLEWIASFHEFNAKPLIIILFLFFIILVLRKSLK